MSRAALAAGLTAAVVLPGEPLGIGLVVVVALIAAAVVHARRLPRERALLGLLALALASVAVWRDATWLLVLDVGAAWLLASLAAGGLALAAPLAPAVRLVTDPPTRPPWPPAGAPAARGVLLGGLLSVPFAALFLSADAAFAELALRIPMPSALSVTGRAFTFALVTLAAAGLALAARKPLAGRAPRPWWPRRVTLLEWLIPLALLNALFGAFVLVQLAVLFGGRDHVLQTAGLTYADYARQGFWQLLLAAGLTLVVVAAASIVVRPQGRGESLLLRMGIVLLAALTLVVLASALRRLWLYEDAFGLTRARVTAEAILLWIGVLLLLAVAALLLPRIRARLPGTAVTVTAVGLLAFSLANPDARIARGAVERQAEGRRIDVAYLSGLSADAAPALARLPRPLAEEALARSRARLARDDGWSAWNLSRARARAALRTR